MSTDIAGRELDIQVAGRIMGWARWDLESGEDCPCEPGVTYYADWGDMGGVAVYTPPHLTGDVEFYFEPSIDISDAWKVVEKVRGWTLEQRARFRSALREIVDARENGRGVKFAHDLDILIWVEPTDICHAAVEAAQ